MGGYPVVTVVEEDEDSFPRPPLPLAISAPSSKKEAALLSARGRSPSYQLGVLLADGFVSRGGAARLLAEEGFDVVEANIADFLEGWRDAGGRVKG